MSYEQCTALQGRHCRHSGEAFDQAEESEVGHGCHASESRTRNGEEVLYYWHVSLIGLGYYSSVMER